MRGLCLIAFLVHAAPTLGADHILLSEIAVLPTDAEFIEISNPTAASVDLSNYYLSDYVLAIDPLNNYWHITDDGLIPDPSFPNDFLARFPAGATIEPGESILIALHDDAAFLAAWASLGFSASLDYELVDDGLTDGVPGLVDPGPALVGVPFIGSSAGLSNSRETVVLFHWDGVSDLVQDVDIVQWSNAGSDFVTVSPDKTGESVDSAYDGDDVSSSYLPDTAPPDQDLASTASSAHDFGRTISRFDFSEGTESTSGGNGLLGHDETSENYSVTWIANSMPSFGSTTSVERESWGGIKASATLSLAAIFRAWW